MNAPEVINGQARFISDMIRSLVNAVFPDRCLACGKLFRPQPPLTPAADLSSAVCAVFQEQMHPYLCRECLPDFSPVNPPTCLQCGKPFQSRTGDSHLCGDCITKSRFFSCVRAAGVYEGPLMKAIHALKYKGKIQLARPLGRLLFHVYSGYDELTRMDIITPIPLHPSRMRKRGFNQAQLLLRDWADLAAGEGRSLNLAPLLVRQKKTLAQTGLGKDARKANIRGAFSLRKGVRVAKKQVLLIDDVYTTGATSEECARILMKNGADAVGVLTLARAE